MINEEANELQPETAPDHLEDIADSAESGSLSEEHTDHGDDGGSSEDGDAPLTLATLLTFTDVGAPWMAIGDGVVTVEVTVESTSGTTSPPPPPSGNGKVGKADETDSLVSGLVSQRVGRLVMVNADDSEEVLLSTPIEVDGLYQVQNNNILIWEDAQLGRTMAFMFRSQEGCDKILRGVTDFQMGESGRADTTLEDGDDAHSTPQVGGKAGGAEGRQTPTPMHSLQHMTGARYAVTVENLADIADSSEANPLTFGNYVRADTGYFRKLAELFDDCEKAGDTASMERIARTTLNLLGSPYNSDGKILGQFMESAYIDKCVDIVQYALGRKDKASGFVSFEERRATFRDPMNLPDSILQRIHLLYSAMYLRDLLPLSLDDGDAGSGCVLNLLLLRFKFTLVSEICSKPELLQSAFDHHRDQNADPAEMFSLVAFVQDLSKMIKNAPVPFEMKEELYDSMIQAGLFPFCRTALKTALQVMKGMEGGTPERRPTRAEAAGAAEESCDVLSHCLFVLPRAREILVSECKDLPSECTLTLVMKCMTLVENSSALQAAHDVVLGAVTGLQALQVLQPAMLLGSQREIARFWVEGCGVDSPPLFLVAAHVATLLHKLEPATSTGSGSTTSVLRATWTHGEELQIVYGLRVLNVAIERIEEGFRTSFAEVLKLSKILEAAGKVMAEHRMRRLENVQSSLVTFLTQLVTMGDSNIMKLLDADGEAAALAAEEEAGHKLASPHRSLLSECMRLYLTCSHRNNILSAALGSLFVHLCTEVHHEKVSLSGPSQALPPQSSYMTPIDGSNSLPPDVATARRDEAAKCRYYKAASALMATYGEQLQVQSPIVAERLFASLNETPEEAKRVDEETSSLPSTIGRSGEGPSEYDMIAMEFGDIAPPVSHTTSDSPLSEAAMNAEDSLLSSLMGSDSGSSSRSSSDIDEDDEEGSSLPSSIRDSEESSDDEPFSDSEEEEKATPAETTTGDGSVLEEEPIQSKKRSRSEVSEGDGEVPGNADEKADKKPKVPRRKR